MVRVLQSGLARRMWRTAICLVCIVVVRPAAAAESMTLAVGTVDGESWSASGIEVRLRLDSGGPAASLTVRELALPQPAGTIRDIVIRCDELIFDTDRLGCDRARIRIGESPLDALPFSAKISYSPVTRHIDFETADLPLGGLSLALTGDWETDSWSLRIAAQSLPFDTAYAVLAEYAPDLPTLEFGAGSASVTAEFAGQGDTLSVIRAQLELADLALGNESGTLASDGLHARLALDGRLHEGDETRSYRLLLQADAGEAYLEPAYLDLLASPLQIESTILVRADGQEIEVESFALEQTGVLSAHGRASLVREPGPGLEDAEFTIEQAIFPGVYRSYLQGYLVGTPLAKLETAGRVSGRAAFADDRLTSAELRFEGLHADDRDGRLALYDAGGELHWRRDAGVPPPRSRLAWGGGFIHRIGFGAAAAEFLLTADRFALPDGLRVPLLDGALVVETLEAAGLDTPTPSVDFDATLEPVGLRRLTTAFGWPAFPGTLSGELRQLALRNGVVTLGGSLVAQLFDGTARITNLRVEQPFGAMRQGTADITLQNLDLALVTDVFTFGRIEGRLDGRIQGLRTLAGRPIAFDASFYTPAGDRSRHRISRRALNNLSEIAGGGTALLSGGFLSLFQDFGYQSLGISCRLEDDVCYMSGVEPAELGYYLVKGKGLPRIDVIGHSREVNWPRLVSQVGAALESGEAATSQRSEGQK